MNTHDKYELPPLPSGHYAPTISERYFYEDEMEKYALAAIEHFLNQTGQYLTNDASRQAAIDAAIEADRKKQGDSAKMLAELIALIPLADTLNASASCQDLIDYFKGVIADRQRRGEPVYCSHPKCLTAAGCSGSCSKAAPQPAEPATKRSLTQDEIQLANWLLRDPTNGERLVFASAPVNEGSFSHVRMRSESGEDWTLTVRLKQGWLTAEQRAANFWDSVKAEKGDQPAEPVVKESLTVAEPVKVPSDAEVASLALRHEAHGEKWPDAEYRFREVDLVSFAHALLAKYGQPAQPAASAEPIGEVIGVTYTSHGSDPKVRWNWPPQAGIRPCPLPVGTKLYTAPVAAQPSVPEPLKYGEKWKDHYVTGWNNCRAAMLAATPPADGQP